MTGPDQPPQVFRFGSPVQVACGCGHQFAVVIRPSRELADDDAGSADLAVTCDVCLTAHWVTITLVPLPDP